MEITGKVEVFKEKAGNNKRWVMKLEDSDQWYSQDKHFVRFTPRKGETVTFDSVQGKFFNRLFVVTEQ
jgi:hypothetical protein